MANIGDAFTLPVPTVGEAGPGYATKVNAVLIEAKVRLAQKVVLALSTDPTGGLPMSSNPITGVSYVTLPSAGSAPATAGTLQAYSGDLYWVDGTGATKLNRQSGGDGSFGDIVVSGATWTIQPGVVTNSKLATMAAHTFKGNNTGSTAAPADLTATQLTAELNTFTASLKGLVPVAPAPVYMKRLLQEDATWGGINWWCTDVRDIGLLTGSGNAATNQSRLAAHLSTNGAVRVKYVFSEGDYYFDKPAGGGFVNIPSIALDGGVVTAAKSFYGQGRATRLIQQGAGTGGDWHFFRLSGAVKEIEFASCLIMTGTVGSPASGDQQHLIQIIGSNGGSSALETADIFIHDVYFGAAYGAQLQMVGEPDFAQYVRRVKVSNCTFEGQGIGLGARSCVEIQRGLEYFQMDNCSLRGAKNSCFDSEITSNGAAKFLDISNCSFNNDQGRTVNLASVGGAGATWPQAQDWGFSNCTFNGGTVNVSSAQRVRFDGCRFIFVKSVNATVDALIPLGGYNTNHFYANEGISYNACSFVNDTGRDAIITATTNTTSYATGTVTFTRASTVSSGTIPISSIVSNGSIQFTTQSAVSFIVGQASASVKVTCSTAGNSGILAAGTITTVVSALFDTFTVTNAAATTLLELWTKGFTMDACVVRSSARNFITMAAASDVAITNNRFTTSGLKYTTVNLTVSRVSTVSSGTIPAGSLFAAGSIQFRSNADSVWVGGNASKVIAATAVVSGPTGLTGASSITTVVSALFDTFTVTNGSAPAYNVVDNFFNMAPSAGNCNGLNISNNHFISTGDTYRQIVALSTGSSARTVAGITLIGNNADQAIDGTNTSSALVTFDKPTADASVFDVNPVIQGNSALGSYFLWIASNQIANKVFPIVEGNKSYRGTKKLEGTITPNGNCVAGPGDIYVWRPTVQTQETWIKTAQTSSAPQTQDFNGWTMMTVGKGFPLGTTLEIMNSTACVRGSLGNGVAYVAMPVGLVSSFNTQFTSAYAGTVSFSMDYAMSAANAGTVIFDFSYVVVADGVDPATALTNFTSLSVTPGNNVLKKTWDSSVSANLAITVTAGATVFFSVSRQNAGTHTGDVRILQLKAVTV